MPLLWRSEYLSEPAEPDEIYEIAVAIVASARVIMELKDREVCHYRDERGIAMPVTPSQRGLVSWHARYMDQAVRSVAADCGIPVNALEEARRNVGRWSHETCHRAIRGWLRIRVALRMEKESIFVCP